MAAGYSRKEDAGASQGVPQRSEERTEERTKDGARIGDGMLEVHAFIYVERQSQKAIVIGKGASRLKDVGTRARKQLEALLGTKVYLSLHVKVAKDWQRDPKQLGRLGF